MAHMGTDVGQSTPPRVDWVDYAKGFCIIMVVMMHSTLGVEAAAGRESWMHALVAFAKPFRMPDFFLISGLFLARVIDRDWRTYLDRKVVHFAYFYLLWVTIQFAFKAPGLRPSTARSASSRLYAEAFVEPFGTLWFIYLLPIFFVVTKLTRRVPVIVIWLIAAALEIAPIQTGWTVIDEFAARFVYFYTGYVLATRIFALAAGVQARPLDRRARCSWSGRCFNGFYVFTGLADKPFISLSLGLIGAAAVVAVSALMAKSDLFAALRYLGQELDRGLSGVLPRHGGLARGAAQDRLPELGTVALLVTAIGHRRRGRAVLGGAPHAAAVPVRAAGLGAARPHKPKYALQPAE